MQQAHASAHRLSLCMHRDMRLHTHGEEGGEASCTNMHTYTCAHAHLYTLLHTQMPVCIHT